MDFVGPIRKSARGHVHILVVVDYFSKWAEAIPVYNTDAKTVARTLFEHIFSRYGFPAELHSDQGAGFTADVITELCHITEVFKTRTTPFNPASDGLVERFNRTLKAGVQKLTETGEDWDIM